MKNFLAALLIISSLVTGAALALQLGDTPALPAALTDSFGKSQPLEKNAYRVFFFYPAASSSGCTTQNIEYTKRYADFIAAKAQVFGVSSDDAKEQCAFIEAQKLKIPQIPDSKNVLGRIFEVGTILRYYSRDTVVVAPNGQIVSLRRGVNPVSDASEVLKFIKTGECKSFTSGSIQCK
jgi:thioredoxin-dependent peroxiredoxin